MAMVQPPTEVGCPIPANVKHAISVTLPTWAANVGYEEGADWVVSKMQCGYPRFFIGKNIQRLVERCLIKFGTPGEAGMLFPSVKCAQRCREFLLAKSNGEQKVRIVEVHDIGQSSVNDIGGFLCIVLFPSELNAIAKQYWQHTGEGISSRLADYFLRQSDVQKTLPVDHDQENMDVHVEFTKKNQNHNRHYSRKPSMEKPIDRHNSSASAGDAETLNRDQLVYLEERYGRNLNLQSVQQAKLAVRRRIAGNLAAESEPQLLLNDSVKKDSLVMQHDRVDVDNVYLYPTGMTSIFQAHQLALRALPDGHSRLSACFGFPYTDTLKVLEKWGAGAIFFGRGDNHDLQELEQKLTRGERLLAIFVECPSNPLLRTPPLQRLRELADQYGFLLVIDETIGNFLNVQILKYADMVVSSLTKVFSGDNNVMGGSLILNTKAPFYRVLKSTLEAEYEDNFWTEDAITLERNSRDFVARIERINRNAETVCEFIRSNKHIKQLYYPKYGPTNANYEAIKTEAGGYGGLFSVVFHTIEEASVFYDALDTAKGPSLGTNFTLASPYTLLAHFTELDWASEYGVSTALVRVSVGLETTEVLLQVFGKALSALDAFHLKK